MESSLKFVEEEKRNEYRLLVGNREGKISLVRLTARGGINNRISTMELKDIGRERVNWIRLPWGRANWQVVVKTVMNNRISQSAENFVSTSGNSSFTRMILHHVFNSLLNS
jgi:hypothetical protein